MAKPHLLPPPQAAEPPQTAYPHTNIIVNADGATIQTHLSPLRVDVLQLQSVVLEQIIAEYTKQKLNQPVSLETIAAVRRSCAD